MPVAQTLASLRTRPAQPFGFRYDIGIYFGVRLTPFALASFFANALAGMAQLGDQTGFLILGEGSGDLAHHLPRDLVAGLIGRGVRIELCGATAKAYGWINDDLLPNIAVNTDAMARTIQLVQQGFIKISEAV